ncbi:MULTISPECIES: hypothetical protein [unclassified Bradyrhizobium]|uniref:hypothetical protein n=1 Tax=unclassified Bradyrhizobium TaxID=2631580 RepID=UPI002916C46E|nr:MULTISPECIES: hypothetical protein [unclassified Bradyrhizobium]
MADQIDGKSGLERCPRCDGTRWICEAHPDLPWEDSPRGCRCGAPGDPCPVCNRADADTPPELPSGFEVDQARDLETDPILEDDIESSELAPRSPAPTRRH